MEHIGRYRVVRSLGQGGMGQVFLAEDPTLERQVAIKLMLRDSSHAGLVDEAKALAALHHPGIVTIHEIGEQDGREFIVMEYVAGKTLRQLIEERAPRHELIAICARVATAVAAAHRAGILHRDIKPENILVSDEGDVKVLDFGIARRLSRSGAARDRAPTARELVDTFTDAALDGDDTIISGGTRTLFGTPAYLAPEVLQGEPSCEQSDIYSLGIVLHEVVAGRRPYSPHSLADLIVQTIEAPPPKLDDPLGDLIAGMLAPVPTARPPLALVARTLEPPPAASPPAKRLARKWPFAVGAAAIVTGSVVIATLRGSSPPTRVDHAAPIEITLTDVEVPPQLFGAEAPPSASLTEILARSFKWVHGPTFAVLKTSRAGSSPTSAYMLNVAVREKPPDSLVATVRLIDRRGIQLPIADITQSQGGPGLGRYGKLLDGVTTAVAVAIDRTATFERGQDKLVAQELYEHGMDALERAMFVEARAYLEQAVLMNDAYFEAWYALTFILGWANSDDTLAAAQRAEALARDGSFEKKLMAGIAAFYDGDFAAAEAVLRDLERDAEAAALASPGNATKTRDLRETRYYLAESIWHDGRYTEGYRMFERVAAVDANFRPIAIHMEEYSFAHHNLIKGAQIVGLASPDRELLLISAGNYAELVRSGTPAHKLEALEILRKPIPAGLPEQAWMQPVDIDSYRLAVSVRAGDRAKANEISERLLARYQGKPDPNQVFGLLFFGEVLLVAGMEDEVRRAVEVYGRVATKHLRHGYHRISILAAGLLHDRTLLVTEKLNHRNGLLSSGIEAELAGDHKKAVAILTGLIRDPSPNMDLPERAALLRNLRALGRNKDALALCRDTMHPFTYRHAIIAFQGLCGRR